jgi:hypothetical protein
VVDGGGELVLPPRVVLLEPLQWQAPWCICFRPGEVTASGPGGGQAAPVTVCGHEGDRDSPGTTSAEGDALRRRALSWWQIDLPLDMVSGLCSATAQVAQCRLQVGPGGLWGASPPRVQDDQYARRIGRRA